MSSYIAAIALVIALSILLYTLNKEAFVFASPNSSYAYQDNKQPFYLTPQSVKLWMDSAKHLCAKRVKTECSGVSKLDKPGCVQRALYECNMANQRYIGQQCANKLPHTLCKKACRHPGALCDQCVAGVQLYGVCQTPDIRYP